MKITEPVLVHNIVATNAYYPEFKIFKCQNDVCFKPELYQIKCGSAYSNCVLNYLSKDSTYKKFDDMALSIRSIENNEKISFKLMDMVYPTTLPPKDVSFEVQAVTSSGEFTNRIKSTIAK
jgi:hypothetical protein